MKDPAVCAVDNLCINNDGHYWEEIQLVSDNCIQLNEHDFTFEHFPLPSLMHLFFLYPLTSIII